MKIRPVFLVAREEAEADEPEDAGASNESESETVDIQKDQPIRMRHNVGRKLNRAPRAAK